ncbi:kinesin-like protein KIF13A isoform X4 [Acanthaster planci]|uniref:Kinesin-like protein KIF13A isoform X4 n=1 Tax=Acanthaster planci TaxID=133434 RepID=A0A8B7ZMQ6_ACAPL|nr:kinesin-like protein KIF13A isoform X4 [Acanthaster planci]
MAGSSSTMSKVKVAVRVRPVNRREIDLGTKCCVDMDEQQTILLPISSKASDRKSPKTFAFDHCFLSMDEKNPKFAGQEKVFKCLGLDILDNAFEGYNACIFAYGQTGSGKSYTMMGTEDNKGIIPRLCDTLFERIAQNEDDTSLSFKVEVSYMEIYNEKVRDLLDPRGKQNLRVREHKIYGPYVDGLSTLAVSSFENIDALMSEGNKSRTVAATNMNSESSRSHAVFNITVTQTLTDIETDESGIAISMVSGEKVSKISLVDLAGSERVQKTGSTGDRLREGGNINKSLTTLGLVISALADQSVPSKGKKKNTFVPYRDSVLTWLLKECLGGNSKTVMVATISPASDNYEETLSTLRYADRAKRIVNHAVINEDPNARIIRELREEVDSLKKQLKEAVSMKADTLKERLHESEKLMKEMTLSWEEKLLKTEQVHKERQQTLERMGISVQTSGIKVERNRCFLVNLNADPSLNELLVYYLKEHTLVGRVDSDKEQDIQLNGLGIMSQHCIIDVENEMDVYLIPMEGAKCCVNGSTITDRTALRHGDRILLGNYHFFRINCPRPPGVGSSGASTPDAEPQNSNYDFVYAQNEVMMKEMTNDPVQAAMQLLESQHQKDKKGALEKQREKYERELESLRKQLMPQRRGTAAGAGGGERTDTAYYSDQSPGSEASSGDGGPNLKYKEWAEERDELFRQSLARLREEVVKANALVREANFLGEEMGKLTEFRVTLQIPACNLTPNRKRGAIVSEPAIQVKRKDRGTQIWSVEKLENKIIDMREMYNERKEKGLPLKDVGPMRPRKLSFLESQDYFLPKTRHPPGIPPANKSKKEAEDPICEDPFYESQENHSLIGVANIFLEVLFHDVRLDYAVPIISQQGEVAGKLHIEIQRISGSIPATDHSVDSQSESSNESSSGYEGLEDHEPEGGLAVGAPLMCRIKIKEATDLPPSLAHFVFCQYTFWGVDGPTVVPPLINPDLEELPGRPKDGSKGSMRFSHSKEFTVNVSEDFIEHALEGSLAIEVWGHRSSGFNTSSKPGWEIDNLSAKSRSLADRWGELIRKIEMSCEIHELNEQGDYVPVECLHKAEVLTGGIFQLRQGHSRRILIRVKPVQNSGTLPIICEAITSVTVGSICARSKLQKGLDSYQDDDLNRLRTRWSNALKRRHEYLDDQIKRIMDKQGKTQKDYEREASLINQWVSLTEERNAVLVPAPGSGIPGAPANWKPPVGMETHIPVLFLDLQADDMGTSGGLEGMNAAGYNSILPKEHGNKMFNLPIVKYCEKDVCAVASWDSSIHDSPHLNRVTSPNERIYLIVKAVVQLSHPATMELVLRKRICVNIYKKQGITSTIKKKMGRMDSVQSCGVTYEIVSNIPKASEDPEDRESLALMAGSGTEENTTSSDGETYIEKYTRGVSAVESILALDRLRQEVVIKEKLASRGRNLRKTASVPNIPGAMSRSIDTSRSMDALDDDFRLIRSESLRNLSPNPSPGSLGGPIPYLAAKPARPRSLLLTDQNTYIISGSAYQPDVYGVYPYGSSPYSSSPQHHQFVSMSPTHSPGLSPHVYLSSPVGLRPVTYSKGVKSLRPVREEQSRELDAASKRKPDLVDSLCYHGNSTQLHSKSSSQQQPHQHHSLPLLLPSDHRDMAEVGDAIFRMSFEDSSEISNPRTFTIGDEPVRVSRQDSRNSDGSSSRLRLDGSSREQTKSYQTSTPQKMFKRSDIFSPRADDPLDFLIDFGKAVDSSSQDLEVIVAETTKDSESLSALKSKQADSQSEALPVFDPLGVVRLDSLEDHPTLCRKISSSSVSGDPLSSTCSAKSSIQGHQSLQDSEDNSKNQKEDSVFINLNVGGSAEPELHSRPPDGSAANFDKAVPLLQPTPAYSRAIFQPYRTEASECLQGAKLNSESKSFKRTVSEDLEMSLFSPQEQELHKSLHSLFQHDLENFDNEWAVFEELEAPRKENGSPSSSEKNPRVSNFTENSSNLCVNETPKNQDGSAEYLESEPNSEDGILAQKVVKKKSGRNAANQALEVSVTPDEISSSIQTKNHTSSRQPGDSGTKFQRHLSSPKACWVHPLLSPSDQMLLDKTDILAKTRESGRLETQVVEPKDLITGSTLDRSSASQSLASGQVIEAVKVQFEVKLQEVTSTKPIPIHHQSVRKQDCPESAALTALDRPPELLLQDTDNNNMMLSWDGLQSSQDTPAASQELLPSPDPVRESSHSQDEDTLSQLSLTDSDCLTGTSASDLDDTFSYGSYDSRQEGSYKSMGNETPSWLSIGGRVDVGGTRSGVVKFAGNTAFRPGIWIGVALDSAVGKHNGCVQGVRYFTCRPKHGIFVRPDRLSPSVAHSASSPAITTVAPVDRTQPPSKRKVSIEKKTNTTKGRVGERGAGDARHQGSRRAPNGNKVVKS